jgi:hypothetical protein
MKKKLLFITVLLGLAFTGFAQSTNKIFTSDIDNFWNAFDHIQTTKDYSKKLQFIRTLYIDKGTKGLKAFMAARDYNDTLYVNLINRLPKFWHSIRPNTLRIKNKTSELKDAIKNLKRLYPELKDAEMYFTIGGLRSGGTVMNQMVLVGAEIATGDSTIDMSEFKSNWLKNVFANQSIDNIVFLNIHEYIHTQQTGEGATLLSKSIHEGACDFIAEMATQKPIKTSYQTYGQAHNNEIKALFKKQMHSNNYSDWLYNGSHAKTCADLGYYVGYQICKSYFDHAKNKRKAIQEIICLDYDNAQAIDSFLIQSQYFN